MNKTSAKKSPAAGARPANPASASVEPALVAGGPATDPKLDHARRLLDGEELGLEALGRAVGLSPTHLQRRFRETFGLSPAEYSAQKKLARLKRELRAPGDVTRAVYEAGYGSSSRVYEDGAARLGMPPGVYRRGGEGMDIRWAVIDTIVGQALIAATERGLCAIALGDDAVALEAELREEFPKATLTRVDAGHDEFLAPRVRAVADLFAGKRGVVPMELIGTAFQQRVWESLMKIPRGETRSYAELADSIGQPRAARAVARACAQNRLAVVVPCHRIIRGDGSLGGYRWGLPRKDALLRAERGKTARSERIIGTYARAVFQGRTMDSPTTPSAASPAKVLIALLSVYLVWGSTYLAIRVGLDTEGGHGYPPFLMGGLRFVAASAVFYTFLRWRGHAAPTRAQWKNAAVMGLLMMLMGNGLVNLAETHVSSGLAAIAVASMPLWAGLFGALKGRHPSAGEWTGLVIGFAGVVWLNFGSQMSASLVSMAALILAPVSWAFGSVWSRDRDLPGPFMSTAAQMICGGIAMLIVGLALGERIHEMPPLQPTLAVAYLAVFGSIVGFTAYVWLLHHVRPALATSYAYVNPPIAVLLGAVLLHEKVDAHVIGAMAVILLGVVIITRAKAR